MLGEFQIPLQTEYQEARMKRGSFSAILWILLVSQTRRQMTLCYPRDQTKNPSQVDEICLGLGEISNTFLEVQNGRDISGWNLLELKLPQSNDGLFRSIIFGAFICYEPALEIMYLYTLRTWYLQCFHQSNVFLPLNTLGLSTLGSWMCYHWSRQGLRKLPEDWR